MTATATTAWDALGHHATLHIHGPVQHDDTGLHITDPDGRRWNLQYDDPVTLTSDQEATS